MLKKIALLLSVLAVLSAAVFAQTTASIKGNVVDSSGATVVGAKVTVTNAAAGIERTTNTTSSGDYEVPALPPGTYTVKVEGSGFQIQQAQHVQVEVSQNIVQNFSLKVASATETVTVEGTAPIVESTTMTVGQTIDQRTVQEIPLNGRHFVDLALLIPGSVTPPQNGFLTAPLRGQGSFAVNTAGNREDAVNWMVNGINLNDMVQNQVTFQPTINTVSEFKVDNSTYSAEYGRNAGAIVNIASRSGTNQFHGELYDYIRNNYFDARNAFNNSVSTTGTPLPMAPFKRNQFGGDFGGPLYKDKTFFFVTYEGLRHRQGLTLTSNVFPDSDPGQPAVITRSSIAAAGNPVANSLLGLIPHANTTLGNSPVPNAFTGSGTAPVNIDQGTVDINHNFNDRDRLHGYYVYQHDLRQEPAQGTDITGFGDTREGHRQVFTLNETHVFASNLVNEANLGVNRILITFTPNVTINPTSLGLASALGPNEQFMPTISVGDQGLLFGAERGFPQGRGDTTSVIGDTVSYIVGRHSMKFGTEFRDFRNGNFNGDPGQLVFNTSTQFQNGTVASAARTVGNVANRITQNALDFFAMDSFKFRSYFTLELGIRYAWNMSPSEADGRFVNFVPGLGTGSMLVPASEPYAQNNKNFQPRVGFAWDVFHNGKTVLRSGYAFQVDEPITGMVTGLSSNPPFALPISVAANPISGLAPLFNGTPASISPSMTNPNFRDANIQSWNLNIQQEITRKTSIMVGYFGSKGTHLEIDQNINQFGVLGSPQVKGLNPTRPFTQLSSNSPILPGVTLANSITEHNSNSNSSYNALWVTGTKQMSHGLQLNASYTYSHSIDDASRNLQGIVLPDSTNLASGRGSSDFDARHRIVISGIYDLPFKGNRLVSGWELAPVFTLQSGNPFTIVVPGNTITGVGNTVTPIVLGPINVTGNPLGQWIAPSGGSFAGTFAIPTNTFGNMGRNSIVGPGFGNFDLALIKNTKLTERLNLQLRCDAFDLTNHPNYGQPGRILSATSGVAVPNEFLINSTRFPTGDSGSARQLQLAIKLMF